MIHSVFVIPHNMVWFISDDRKAIEPAAEHLVQALRTYYRINNEDRL